MSECKFEFECEFIVFTCLPDSYSIANTLYYFIFVCLEYRIKLILIYEGLNTVGVPYIDQIIFLSVYRNISLNYETGILTLFYFFILESNSLRLLHFIPFPFHTFTCLHAKTTGPKISHKTSAACWRDEDECEANKVCTMSVL